MKRGGQPAASLGSRIAPALLIFYKRAISPMVHAAGGSCRFQPSCSEYAAIAVAEYGLARGGLMAMGRLLRCHPLHRGGYDPVQPRNSRGPATGDTQITQVPQRSSAS